jgi:hypothetical protein
VPWQVVLKPRAQRALARLDRSIQKRLITLTQAVDHLRFCRTPAIHQDVLPATGKRSAAIDLAKTKALR